MRSITNIMRIPTHKGNSYNAIFEYVKPTLKNCKVTFVDGSVYWLKAVATHNSFKSEPNKLYLDEECTVLADVTRKQKLYECRRMGLI